MRSPFPNNINELPNRNSGNPRMANVVSHPALTESPNPIMDTMNPKKSNVKPKYVDIDIDSDFLNVSLAESRPMTVLNGIGCSQKYKETEVS